MSTPLDVLIQINIDAEPQKAGIAPEALAEFAAHLLALPRLRLRGLMAIPRAEIRRRIGNAARSAACANLFERGQARRRQCIGTRCRWA